MSSAVIHLSEAILIRASFYVGGQNGKTVSPKPPCLEVVRDNISVIMLLINKGKFDTPFHWWQDLAMPFFGPGLKPGSTGGSNGTDFEDVHS